MSTPLTVALIAAASAVGSAVISGIIGTVLGSYLQRRSIEHEIRFSRLYERRAEVIEHLHELLGDAQKAFEDWTRPGHLNSGQKMYAWVRVLGKFETHYKQHRLWLDDRLIGRLDHFLEECHRLYGRALRAGAELQQPVEETQVSEGATDTERKNDAHMNKQFSEAREELARKFRKLLFGR